MCLLRYLENRKTVNVAPPAYVYICTTTVRILLNYQNIVNLAHLSLNIISETMKTVLHQKPF